MLLRPFIELRNKLYEKYGIEEITPAMCYAVADYPVVSKVTATSVTRYLDQTLESFEEFYHKLYNALNEAYFVSFDWNGQGRKVILMKSGGYVFKHHSRFDDSDNYTHLDLEYDEKTNTFLAYCNAVISESSAIERAKKCMSNVVSEKIKL
jgi:hypothetical protein